MPDANGAERICSTVNSGAPAKARVPSNKEKTGQRGRNGNIQHHESGCLAVSSQPWVCCRPLRLLVNARDSSLQDL